jgi:putative Mg2+ transporter-C (MgtC) family protein
MQFDLVLQQLTQLDPTPFVLAIVLGGAIGLEREAHGRPAGLRTHIIVCLAATMLIHASQSMPANAEGLVKRMVYDPNRLGAGVVTGIGFLGAAAVIRSGDLVRGITTGACVWSVAVLGVVIGQGRYGLAIAATVAMLTVLMVFDRLFSWFTPVIYRRVVVRGPGPGLGSIRDDVSALLREFGIRVQDLSGQVSSNPGPFEVVFHVRCRNRIQAAEVLDRLSALDTVNSVEWKQPLQ